MNKQISEVSLNINGAGLHLIPSKKFKTIHIVVKFCAPLERETITMRALIPYIIQKGSSQYPSEQQLQLKLNNLYGAVLSVDGAKKGNNHIISFRLEIANEKYITDDINILDEAITLLQNIIFSPHTKGESFIPETFQREKETLNRKINAIIDDKMMYANMRLIDEMCKGEAYALHIHGYTEDLNIMTAEELFKYYKKVLTDDQLDIYVLGDFDKDSMQHKIEKTFMTTERKRLPAVKENTIPKTEKPKLVVDEQNIQQAKLHLGYRTNCTFNDPDYYALQVFNGIYGGFPSSKLFENVREKNSLAYYASSSIESHKGLLLVYSGIAAKDYEQAREIIELQMAAMKSGQFTQETLENTKQLIVNQLLETIDQPNGIIELLYQQVIGHKAISPEQLINKIREVSQADVIHLADKIEADTVYLLTSKVSEFV